MNHKLAAVPLGNLWGEKVDVIRLQEAGGWASLDMPRRYIERAQIANLGMTDE